MSTSRTGSLRARPTTRQTHRSGRQRAGPLRYVGPPRPGPLPKCPSMGKMTTDSTYEWRKIGEQVTGGALNPETFGLLCLPVTCASSDPKGSHLRAVVSRTDATSERRTFTAEHHGQRPP